LFDAVFVTENFRWLDIVVDGCIASGIGITLRILRKQIESYRWFWCGMTGITDSTHTDRTTGLRGKSGISGLTASPEL
jgi:hypothetical protein